MKKILLTLLATSYLLVADALPNSQATTIAKVDSNREIQLSSNIPKGMSGIIIHNYGNGLSAITYSAISKGNGKASIEAYRAIRHKKIPSIQTKLTVGDKVMFGNFYDNALLIAPNQSTYRRVTQSLNRTWVHPDEYAVEFMKEGETSLNFKSLKRFAQLHQVGLILIVQKDKVAILDPISKEFLGTFKADIQLENPMSPFYARFKITDTSTFGFSNKNYPSYFNFVSGFVK